VASGSTEAPKAEALTAAHEDSRRAGSESRLVELIRAEIEEHRRITFARFMERALTEPGLGYYATSETRPTPTGDFVTAPELHPFFGRCVARQLTEVWARLGEPATFTVREYGAGRGTLAATVSSGLEADRSGLLRALDWQGLDLEDRGEEPREGRFTGAVVANEFLDTLPVHRVVLRDGNLLEHYVTWRDGWFAEEEDAASTPQLAEHLAADGVTLAEGQLAEICLAAPRWLATAAADLERGLLLVIDYGHPAAELYGPRRMAGTLLTYRAQSLGDDPFSAVGSQDLTAHVDFTAIDRTATGAGLEAIGTTTQAEFLAGLGLGQLLSDLGSDPGTDPQAYVAARTAVARLLDPRHLGAFGVLLYARDLPPGPPLAGLAYRTRREAGGGRVPGGG
jgi:SAM-dependent MidA family methyltransferase